MKTLAIALATLALTVGTFAQKKPTQPIDPCAGDTDPDHCRCMILGFPGCASSAAPVLTLKGLKADNLEVRLEASLSTPIILCPAGTDPDKCICRMGFCIPPN